MDDKFIIIFGDNEESTWSNSEINENPINLQKFKNHVTDFYNNMASVIDNLPEDKKSGFTLDEITINAEISASGKVGFLGSGVSAGVKGSLSFKLKRQD